MHSGTGGRQKRLAETLGRNGLALPAHTVITPPVAAWKTAKTARKCLKMAKKYPRGYLKSPSIHADDRAIFLKTGGSICFDAELQDKSQ